MKVRKTLLWDGDGLGGQACVAVDFVLASPEDAGFEALHFHGQA
jgi:hypothetical protein